MKLFPNVTRHHLITHTYLLSVLNFLFQLACCAANKARAQNLNERCVSEGIIQDPYENEDPLKLNEEPTGQSFTETEHHGRSLVTCVQYKFS